MLRAFLKLGKARKLVPRRRVEGVVYFEEERAVALHDKGVLGGVYHGLL
jgi:hypothetical protein